MERNGTPTRDLRFSSFLLDGVNEALRFVFGSVLVHLLRCLGFLLIEFIFHRIDTYSDKNVDGRVSLFATVLTMTHTIADGSIRVFRSRLVRFEAHARCHLCTRQTNVPVVLIEIARLPDTLSLTASAPF